MVTLDLKSKGLFGNEAGEDEDIEVLNSYYVDHEDFDDFFDENQCLAIVSARKGMGKSALLSRLQYKLEKNVIPSLVVRAKGNDLLGLGDFANKDQAYLESYWKQIICKKIIIEIGNKIGFALSGHEISFVELAELEGIKKKNILGSLLSRIKGKIPLVEAELTTNVPSNMAESLSAYQRDHADSKVWVLIDDIDAKYQNTPEYQARVGSFFSAIRSLSHDVNNINVRATVRSDVWSCLRHLEDLDKIDQYITEIFWSKREMRDILANRILSYVKRHHQDSAEAKYILGKDYNKILDIVFNSPIVWNKDPSARLFEAISAFSNRRPRWMGQLCRMAAKKSRKPPAHKKINIDHINYVLEEYGKKRRDDLIKEHSHQFAELEGLIDAFRATAKEFSYTDILAVVRDKYIRGRPAEEIPPVDGSPYVNEEDLGNFLFKLGLVSRVYDDGKSFTHYVDDPDLFRSIENKTGRLVWSVHPAYRQFLNIK